MKIKIANLYPYEPCVTSIGVAMYKATYSKEGYIKKLPHVVKIDGEWMVKHGHHRVVALIESGEKEIEVEVLSHITISDADSMSKTLKLRKKNQQQGFNNYKTDCNTDGRATLSTNEQEEIREMLLFEGLQKTLKKQK